MPRPRFEKLAEGKRRRILEAAAKEFATYGYENASLNRMLEEAGISKGAAYYYFDDKADLYTTTLLHYLEELLEDMPFDVSRFTAEKPSALLATKVARELGKNIWRKKKLRYFSSSSGMIIKGLA